MAGKPQELSLLEFHVLLALAGGPRYGYALKTAVEDESRGAIAPRAGSLYRVLSRMMAAGLVREARPEDAEPHPGLERRYYTLTGSGRHVLGAEAHRLKHAAVLAEKRLGWASGRS
ncbi:MAG: PadR family transcriptional regulator [Gemmatimonadaceae bacterium]